MTKEREKIADDKEEKRPDDKDPVYRLFKWSYARQFLAHVVFVAAIIVSILTYWEFVKYLNYPLWAYLVGIMPVLIISGLIAKIRYDNKKEADEKQTKK
jgi:amino acid transporter